MEALRRHEQLKRSGGVMTDRRTPFRAGGTGALEAAAVPQFTGTYTLLADVSEFQPDVADSTYLKWSKAIVIRALYGDAHDDAAWYGGARRALLHSGGARFLGIYSYLVGSQSGAAQAQAFHKLVGGILPGEVFIADFEEGSHAVLTEWYNAMISLYGKGIAPFLWTYTGLVFGEATGALPVQWLADYTSREPSSPHKLWQFSSSYSVPGVGSCDASVFHGSIDQLAALAYQPAKPAPPAPPADWTYGPPQHLTARGGRTSVELAWEPPAGAPQAPAAYQVFIYYGATCSRDTIVPSYPRTVHGLSHLEGSLPEGRSYTAHVVAAGPNGTRVRPYTYASVAFTTG
jgi:hypothetical protein